MSVSGARIDIGVDFDLRVGPMNDVAERDGSARILSAAGAVFLAEGFERTSVDMIAAAARMSKQSIYELFPNKVALFEAAVRNGLDDARLNMADVDGSGGIEATLTRYGLLLFKGHSDPVNFGLFRANIAATRHFPELANELHDRRLAASRPLADYLERLLAEGRIDACDPAAMAIRFGGLVVEGARYFLGSPPPDAAARAASVATAVRLFLGGYRDVKDEGFEPVTPGAVEPPALAGTVALRLSPEKVAALVDAATAEFLAQGYQGASIDRIASAVRASKATIYRQFGSKEKLLRYVIQHDIFETSRTPVGQNSCPDNLDAALTAFARQVLDEHLAPSNLGMHRLLVEQAERVADLALDFHDHRARRVGDALGDFLLRFGEPLPSKTARRAFYVLATFAIRFVTSTKLPDADLRDRYSRETALLFLRGIRNSRP